MGSILNLEFLIFGFNFLSNFLCLEGSSWLLWFNTSLKLWNTCFLGSCGSAVTSWVFMLSFTGWTNSCFFFAPFQRTHLRCFYCHCFHLKRNLFLLLDHLHQHIHYLGSFQCLRFHRNIARLSVSTAVSQQLFIDTLLVRLKW